MVAKVLLIAHFLHFHKKAYNSPNFHNSAPNSSNHPLLHPSPQASPQKSSQSPSDKTAEIQLFPKVHNFFDDHQDGGLACGFVHRPEKWAIASFPPNHSSQYNPPLNHLPNLDFLLGGAQDYELGSTTGAEVSFCVSRDKA